MKQEPFIILLFITDSQNFNYFWNYKLKKLLPQVTKIFMVRFLSLIFFFSSLASLLPAQLQDWPMWRFDHNRSASTPEPLPEQLYPQWQIKYSERIPVWDDPLNQNLMQFDRLFEPVTGAGMIFIGFNDQDKVLALDINTGLERWHFYTDGPVRMPLAFADNRVYLTGDDGYLYCLDAITGQLRWKLLLAPSENKLLGNKRMISMWPARGGLVIQDGILYTAASIFPLMGTYIYAINAETGSIIWKNEATGSNYILQPHRSPAFADVAPQGAFTISGNKLLVAGGRSVPAAFDAATGEELYYQLAASGKTGGAFTCANDRVFFNHHRDRMTWMYDSENGNRLQQNAGEYPVVHGDTIYFSGERINAKVLGPDKKLTDLWTSELGASTDLIRAGNVLYAADSLIISALEIINGTTPKLIWSYKSDETVERLIAARGKLIAVTTAGTIKVFGSIPSADFITLAGDEESSQVRSKDAEFILSGTGVSEGFSLVFGTADLKLLQHLAVKSNLSIIAYERDRARIEYLRSFFDAQGLNSSRISFLPLDSEFPRLPQYFSSLTIIDDEQLTESLNPELLARLYELTRPYGGKVWIRTGKGSRKTLLILNSALEDFKSFTVSSGRGYYLLERQGAIEGTAPWTHNYGNIANTVKSDDKMVKAPLGILWFGGSSNLDVLPRHGHGPGEQVIDGRLIIQGINSISARDVYTGRELWKRNSEKLMDDTWLVYFDESYDEENPLDPKYNQEHMSGANSRGTNFIATKEYVYLIEGDKCILLDIKTGAVVKEFTTGSSDTRELAYIGVYEDLLILGSNFTDYPGIEGDTIIADDPRFTDYNRTASSELFVLNRFTGEKLWNQKSVHGFIHNAIIAGDDILFCLDKLPQYLETKLRRRGELPPGDARLLYIDIRTGKINHEEKANIFGTWLGYSSEYKLLLQATRPSRDMLNGESGSRIIAYNVPDRSVLWDRNVKYNNPPIIHNDKIYTEGEGFMLLSGDPLFEKDPVTGEDLKWSFKREYGCGIVAASEHLLTFRSASAGFVNLDVFEGTASLGGWKPGCSTNLIVADGVLNSPDYTRTCQCPYQNQTSLALVHMPWMTYWTNSNYKWNGKKIQQLGLNFGAPGDRTADNNTLWFEFPYVAGAAPEIPVKIDSSGYYTIRKEPVSVTSSETPWVSASAVCGLRSILITLSGEEISGDDVYTVRIHFSELEEKEEGERIFDVSIQGQKMIEALDIVKEAGIRNRELIKTFTGIRAGRDIRIDLKPSKGKTIISGIELIKTS
jgi:outer membrane protein assembly factor BamB